MKRFVDKVVLITGGTSGIGSAVAKHMAEEGASVIIQNAVKPLTLVMEL